MPAHKKEPTVEVEERFCKKQNKATQHRRYKIERKWVTDPVTGDRTKTGEYRYQWRCYECVTEADLKAKAKRGVKVGEFKKAQLRKQREREEKVAIDKAMSI